MKDTTAVISRDGNPPITPPVVPDVLNHSAFTRIGDVVAPTGQTIPVYAMCEYFNSAEGWSLSAKYGIKSLEYKNAKVAYYAKKAGGEVA